MTPATGAALGVEPVLIGALAAAAYQQTPRATTDVDFLVRSLAGGGRGVRT